MINTSTKDFKGYRIGVNIPTNDSVWGGVDKAINWGAPVVEINKTAETLGENALDVVKQLAKANDLKYTWHLFGPPGGEQPEFAIPDRRRNENARDLLTQAIIASQKIGAQNITIHPTFQAARLPEGYMYIYDERKEQMQPIKKPLKVDGTPMKDTEFVEFIDKSNKADLIVQRNKVESNLNYVKHFGDAADSLLSEGFSPDKLFLMVDAFQGMHAFGQAVGIAPSNVIAWQNIQKKVMEQKPLTESEIQTVMELAKNTRDQIGNLKTQFQYNLDQTAYDAKKEHLFVDGVEKMKQNFAENVAKVIPAAIHPSKPEWKPVSIGIENLGSDALFNQPQEIDELRDRLVNELVTKHGIKRAEAEKWVGITFDTAHANTTRYLEIEGKKYTPSEFLKKLKGPVVHVHAVDGVGTIDAHLPLGQGEINKEEWEKIKKELAGKGFTGRMIYELGGSQTGPLYASSAYFAHGEEYMVGSMPTTSMWGPSYLMASMVDPILFTQKEKGYFYDTWEDIF